MVSVPINMIIDSSLEFDKICGRRIHLFTPRMLTRHTFAE